MMNRKQTKVLKKAWQTAVIILLNILIIVSMAAAPEVDALSRQGSRGAEVTEIQTRLIKWGYLKGKADGVYGAKTKAAVIYFQKKNNLVADGIAGDNTLRAMGINVAKKPPAKNTTNPINTNSSDLNLLARLISAESRGEPYAGEVAVGACVLNRVKHPSFPDTISGVIYQRGAFSCLTDGQFNQPVTASAKRAAQDALNGIDPSGGAIFYYNPKKTKSTYMRSRKVIVTIGAHLFCS